MPLAFIKSLTRKNVVFYNLTHRRLMKLIHLLTGEEQIPFREKDVSKDSDASKEKNIHHYWLF